MLFYYLDSASLLKNLILDDKDLQLDTAAFEQFLSLTGLKQLTLAHNTLPDPGTLLQCCSCNM